MFFSAVVLLHCFSSSAHKDALYSTVILCWKAKAGKTVGWRSRGRWLRRRRRDDCSNAATSSINSGRRTSVCDASKSSKRHPTQLLTDLNNPSNRTCWVSAPTALTDDTSVNVTVNLGKKYEVRIHTLHYNQLYAHKLKVRPI